MRRGVFAQPLLFPLPVEPAPPATAHIHFQKVPSFTLHYSYPSYLYTMHRLNKTLNLALAMLLLSFPALTSSTPPNTPSHPTPSLTFPVNCNSTSFLASLFSFILPGKLNPRSPVETPPTEFLPYPPPKGYVWPPGTSPQSENPQPSEFDPPYGFYTGESNGVSGSESTSQATSHLLDVGLLRLIRAVFPNRNHQRGPYVLRRDLSLSTKTVALWRWAASPLSALQRSHFDTNAK